MQKRAAFGNCLAVLMAAVCLGASCVRAQQVDEPRFDTGAPVLNNLWVDPVSGRDSNPGTSQAQPLKTVDAAWGKIPSAATLSVGFRINLLPGTYPVNSLPNYWESKYGTAAAPIVLTAVNGKDSVTWLGGMNVFDVKYLYLDGFQIVPRPVTDVFHCEQCDHVLIRNMKMKTDNVESRNSVKVNQSSYMFLEDSDLEGGYAAGVDFVAVQHGHLLGNVVHGAQDWCHWNKGGTAYITIEGNEFHHCGTGGYTAGQGTGFEFMTSPWLHYEASDIKFVNNVVHDVDGAGVGVNGGYNILINQNTFYHVGTRDHIVEVVFGLRSCDGDASACATRLALGGWGRTTTGSDTEPIPDRNVYIYNNVFYNPSGVNAGQLFSIFGPQTPATGSNIPSPAKTDDNLRIKGNVFWNGGVSTILGIEDSSQGCQPGNAECNQSQLTADNTFDGAEPVLQNPDRGDYRPSSQSPLLSTTALSVPMFSGGDRPSAPAAPEGNLANVTEIDFNQVSRGVKTILGAFSSADSMSANPTPTPTPTPIMQNPKLSAARVSPRSVHVGKRVTFSVAVRASSSAISKVSVTIGSRHLRLKKTRGATYAGTWTAAKPIGVRLVSFGASVRNGSSTTVSGGTVLVKR